ncbi:MAG TPA: ABC transporter permease, partial [Puia sp.]|nr:ABC transporter permease [Puia sp.]
MLRNYLKTAWRNLTRHKLFSFINLVGLSTSMAVGLFVIMLVMEDFSYDHFHPKKERIFRINTEVAFKNGTENWATAPAALADELTSQYLDAIDATVRFKNGIHSESRANNRELTVQGMFTEPSFFKLFQFDLAAGDKLHALNDPYAVVLSEETARKFFGGADPLGKTIFLKQYGMDFVIRGVIRSAVAKTHFVPDIYVSWSSINALQKLRKIDSLQNWNDYSATHTYVLLRPGISAAGLTNHLRLLEQNANLLIKEQDQKKYHFSAQSLESISPARRQLWDDFEAGSSMNSIYLNIGIGLIILLLACFNYTNLSMARSLSRAKEIGIRKVNGAGRLQVFTQFIAESVMFSFIALLAASLLLQAFSGIDKVRELINGQHLSFAVWGCFLLFSIFTGLLAGIIPAWVFASFRPAQVLKSLAGVKLFRGLTLRKILISLQFSASIILMVVMLVMYRQTRFMVSSDYGFSRTGIVNIPLKGINYKAFSTDVKKINYVESVSASSGLLGFVDVDGTSIAKSVTAEPLHLDYFSVDQQFVRTMNLQLMAGASFPETISDSNEQYVLLNQKAINLLQLGDPPSAIGKTVYLDDDKKPLQVIGVMKDFHYLSKKMSSGAMALRYRPEGFQWANIQVK